MQELDKFVKENDFKNHIDLHNKLQKAFEKSRKENFDKTTDEYLQFCRDKGLKARNCTSLQAFMGGVACN